MKYVKLIKDFEVLNPDDGSTFFKRSKGYILTKGNSSYSVYKRHGSWGLPIDWVENKYSDCFEEITREEIDTMKIGRPIRDLYTYSYTPNSHHSGVVMYEPQIHFIYDEVNVYEEHWSDEELEEYRDKGL